MLEIHGEWKCLICGAYYEEHKQQTVVELPNDARGSPSLNPTDKISDFPGVDPSDKEWLAAKERERKTHPDSRSALTKKNHWLRWECLRRSEEYQLEWARLEKKYRSQPTEKMALSQWREALTARNQIAYRGQDEAFVTRGFGLYDLYHPSRTFPNHAPPAFGQWPAAEPATPTLIDLYRYRPRSDSVIPESPLGLPFLAEGKFLIIANFRATKEELVADLLRIRRAVIGNKRQYIFNPDTHTITYFPSYSTSAVRSKKLNYVEKYLETFDLIRVLPGQQDDKLVEIARRLFPTEWRKKGNHRTLVRRVRDCLTRADAFIDAAADGSFPH